MPFYSNYESLRQIPIRETWTLTSTFRGTWRKPTTKDERRPHYRGRSLIHQSMVVHYTAKFPERC